MEGLLTNYYEYHFLYINGIHHVESRNIQGMALMKLYFHPGTNMAQAMAETIGYVNRSRAFMPPGTVSPVHHPVRRRQRPGGLPGALERDQVDRRDPGPGAVQGPADVRQPAGRLGAAAVRRQPADRRRPARPRPAARLPAVARRGGPAPDRRQRDQPLGQRPDRQDRCRSSRSTRWSGRSRSWRRSRSGPGRSRTSTSATWRPIKDAHATSRPAMPWSTAAARCTSSSPSGPTPRRSRWSTNVKAALPSMQAVLPDDIKVSFEFDQSPYVTNADRGAWRREGALGAVLTGLMVLLFLRDWRSVIVVVLNIPFALLRRGRGALADRPDDQPDDAGRAGAGRRHPGGRSDRRGREHPPPDGRHVLGRPRGPARQPADGRAAAAGDALRAGGVPAVVLHAGGGAGAVRAAVAGRRLRDGRRRICSPARSCRCCRSGCCGTITTSGRRRDARRLRRSIGPATPTAGPLPPSCASRWADRAGLSRRRAGGDRAGGPVARPGDLPQGRRRAVPAPPARADGTRIEETERLADRRARTRSRRRSAARTWRSRSATSA